MEYDTIFGADLTAHKDIVKSVRKHCILLLAKLERGGWSQKVNTGEGGGGGRWSSQEKRTYLRVVQLQKFMGMQCSTIPAQNEPYLFTLGTNHRKATGNKPEPSAVVVIPCRVVLELDYNNRDEND